MTLADGGDTDIALNVFTRSYIDAALWTLERDCPDRSDGECDVRALSESTLRNMKQDCERFYSDNASALKKGTPSQGGHDFWLTREGEGAGFLDGDWPEPEATRLYEAAKKYQAMGLYVDDDGEIHGARE